MHARWQAAAPSGEGAALFPGRWNKPGERMVYLADSLALAALETLVHLEAHGTDGAYIAFELTLPGEAVERVDNLPTDWQHDLTLTRERGSRWLRAGQALAMSVPSVLVPDGANLLLNPAHAAAVRIVEVRKLEFRWDDRLF